jgi:hypothetical protein
MVGAKGGAVLEKMTSPTTPSASVSRSLRALSQLRSPSVAGSPSTPMLRSPMTLRMRSAVARLWSSHS